MNEQVPNNARPQPQIAQINKGKDATLFSWPVSTQTLSLAEVVSPGQETLNYWVNKVGEGWLFHLRFENLAIVINTTNYYYKTNLYKVLISCQGFTPMNSNNSRNSPERYAPSLALSCRWGNWGTERLTWQSVVGSGVRPPEAPRGSAKKHLQLSLAQSSQTYLAACANWCVQNVIWQTLQQKISLAPDKSKCCHKERNSTWKYSPNFRRRLTWSEFELSSSPCHLSHPPNKGRRWDILCHVLKTRLNIFGWDLWYTAHRISKKYVAGKAPWQMIPWSSCRKNAEKCSFLPSIEIWAFLCKHEPF